LSDKLPQADNQVLRLSPGSLKRFEFVEMALEPPLTIERGFEHFVKGKSLSGDATEVEIK
jgi:hypothetical protein